MNIFIDKTIIPHYNIFVQSLTTYKNYYDIHELPTHVFEEMMHFFEVYKSLEHKQTTVKEICHRDEAVDIINKCVAAYEKAYDKKGAKKDKK